MNGIFHPASTTIISLECSNPLPSYKKPNLFSLGKFFSDIINITFILCISQFLLFNTIYFTFLQTFLLINLIFLPFEPQTVESSVFRLP